MTTELAIETRNVVKSFGRTRVLDGLDLRVRRGTVYGLLGRNAAGKTTTLRLLMGLQRPSDGEAHVLGQSLLEAPAPVRQRVTYVPQLVSTYRWSLEALCQYAATLYPRWDAAFAGRLIRQFELPKDRRVDKLSGGQQRCAAVVLALAARPEVLLLDEPGAGLDPITRRAFLDALVDALTSTDGTTVLLSSHLLQDVERIAEEIGFLDGGRLTLSKSLEELQNESCRVQIIFDGDHVPETFAIPGARRVESVGAVYNAILLNANQDALDTVRAAGNARVRTFPLSLEDVFIELQAKSDKEVEAA